MTITEKDVKLHMGTPDRGTIVLYDSELDVERHQFLRALEYSREGYSLDKGWDVPPIGDIYYAEKPKRVVKRVSSGNSDNLDEYDIVKEVKTRKINSYTKLLDVSIDALEI